MGLNFRPTLRPKPLAGLITALVLAALPALHAQTADTLVVTAQPSSVRANQTFTLTVEAQDSTMGFAVDTAYTSAVTLAIDSGAGTLGGVAVQNAVAGVATFTDMTLDTISAVVLEASDGAIAPGLSSAISVTADRLVIITPATIADTTAGETLNGATGIEIAARDGHGNTDTGFTGDVTAALSSGTGTLAGTTVQAAVAGVATLGGLSINLIGSKQLTFSSPDLASVNSNLFDVLAAADDQLAFLQQPSNVIAGEPIAPAITVRILDEFGNQTGSAATVALAIGTNPGGATLGGTTSLAAQNGVASFGNITLNAGGNGYTLLASATGLGGDTSAAFNVITNGGATLAAAPSNPDDFEARPGTSANVLVVRLTESSGTAPFTLSSATTQITLLNNTGNAAANALAAVSLRRGADTLATVTNGGSGWHLAGNAATVTFNGLASVINAGEVGDFAVALTFAGAAAPTPEAGYVASMASSGINLGVGVTGGPIIGGAVTLRDEVAEDLSKEEDEDRCGLSARGGPAPAMAVLVLAVWLLSLAYRRHAVE